MRAYLDHASTSPLRPGVADAMAPWLGAADPSRVHTEGRMARVALEDARTNVAAALGCRGSREVVFTSGATEAVAAACFGATRRSPAAAFVAAAVEHSSVLQSSALWGPVVSPAVDGTGRVDVDGVRAALDAGPVALVHVQWGNHEVGTLQPVAEVVALCRERGVLVHVGAAQAAGRVPVDFATLDADLLSCNAHKLGGPRGIGALLVRRGLRLQPLLVGGDQERARRAGLEDVAAAAGFAAAVSAPIPDGLDALTARVLVALTAVDGVHAYTPTERLPHIACVGIDGVEAEPVLLGLDQAGVAVHSGSSCSSEALEPSPVLLAMGADGDRSLRVSVGWSTTAADVERLAAAFPEVVGRLRSLRG